MEYTMNCHDNKGYAVAMDGETEAGRMTYSKAGNTRVIIDHTEVNPNYNGQGVGLELFKKIITCAREKGWQILPLCPFAQAMFKKYPEYNDILTQ